MLNNAFVLIIVIPIIYLLDQDEVEFRFVLLTGAILWYIFTQNHNYTLG